MENKELAKKKIQQVVYLHAVHVKNMTGLEINTQKEEKRIYAEWQAGLVTLEDIQKDIEEYLEMRNETKFGK